MIQIDLLPDHLRPIKRTPLPYIVSTLVWAVAVLAIVGAYLASAATIAGELGSGGGT